MVNILCIQSVKCCMLDISLVVGLQCRLQLIVILECPAHYRRAGSKNHLKVCVKAILRLAESCAHVQGSAVISMSCCALTRTEEALHTPSIIVLCRSKPWFQPHSHFRHLHCPLTITNILQKARTSRPDIHKKQSPQRSVSSAQHLHTRHGKNVPAFTCMCIHKYVYIRIYINVCVCVYKSHKQVHHSVSQFLTRNVHMHGSNFQDYKPQASIQAFA
jgi:hypothetical protein